MQTELFKNMVYEWADKEAPHSLERLLWLDQSSPFVWTIKIYGNSAQPVRRSRESLQDALDTGAARVVAKDPFAYLIRPERDIKESHRKHRDEAWDLISPLVENGDTRIFQFYGRNSPVTALVKSKRCSQSKAYRELRRYLQRGQMKNANLPLYDNCGWRDRLDNPKAAQKKQGRPSKVSAATGESRGINITRHILQAFRDGIALFYDKRLSAPLSRAFQQTLEKFFNCGYHQNKNGVWVASLPPAHELPTYRQFKYWYNKERKPRQSQVARRGTARFNLSGRAKLGNSTQMAYGPGSVFQVDATIGDVYLLSSLNRRWIIGRPVIYFIIDLFSRLIVGLSIALEGPSWLGAMLALENSVMDKVAFCAEYDISIEYSDWTTHHLPEALMADRGEFEGYNADQLVNAFSTRVYNTSPYRADLKGVVEQHIDISNEKTIHWLPGRVRKRERGDRDYRLDAALTLWEFRKIMTLAALHHNHHQYIEDYPLEADMIADRVEPFPINLWRWGLKHRSGCLRKQDIETVRLNLLPEAEASVTQNGIYFSNLHYTSELALKEQWFERAGERGTWKIPVAHDPRTRSRIYLRLDNGKRLETCHLVPGDKAFLDRDWYETLDEFESRKQRIEVNQTRHQRSMADYHASTQQVIDAAKEENAMSRIDMSDRSRIMGIRANRKQERDLEREANAWEFGPDPKTSSESTQSPVPGYVPPPQPTDKLRSIRERMLKK
jgi:putative transposase